jgi:hypothetical protein
VPYSLALFEGTSLFNKILNLQSRSTNTDIPQGQAGMNDIHTSVRQRTQSLPINFGSTTAATPDYNMLLQLGQQMLGSDLFHLNYYHTSAQSSGLPLFRSQLNSSYYLGGDLEKVFKTNHNNYGSNRHHPYGSSGGSKGNENSHNSNSHYSSSKSGQYNHSRRDNDRHHGGRRRH